MEKSKNHYAIKSIICICLIFFSFIVFNNNIFAEEMDTSTNRVSANNEENTKISNIFDIDVSTNAYKFSENKSPKGPFIRYIAERVIVDRELSGIGTIISNKTIDVTAPTTGIQVLFGTDTVRINSDMEYAVVLSSTNVIVEGNITKDLIVFSGGKLTIGENAKISGDVIYYGNDADIKGTIQGNFIGAVQDLKLEGTIVNDLRIKVNNVELIEGNKVNGNIFFMTYNKNLTIKDNYPNAEIKVYEPKNNAFDLNTILAGITTSLLFTLLYLLVEKLSKGNVFSKMITKTRQNSLFFCISGALSLMLVLPLVFVLSMLSFIGLSAVAIPTLITYIAYLLVVGLLSTFIIGSFLVKYMSNTRFKNMGVGVKILSSIVIFMLLFILARIPAIGGYVTLLLVMFALGIVTTCVFKKEKKKDTISNK